MAIKAIIFDYAGVLGVDGYWAWLRQNIVDLEQHTDYFHKISQAVDSADISADEFVSGIALKAGLKPSRVEREILELLTVYPEMVKLIADLKQHYKIGLLSNFIFEWLDPVLHKYDLYRHIDFPVISTAVRLKKPDPEIYKLALRGLKVSPEEAVFIDDREVNLVPARTLGMKAVICEDPKTFPDFFWSVLESF